MNQVTTKLSASVFHIVLSTAYLRKEELLFLQMQNLKISFGQCQAGSFIFDLHYFENLFTVSFRTYSRKSSHGIGLSLQITSRKNLYIHVL